MTHPSDLPPTTFHHFTIAYSNFEFIKGLSHSLSQSFHDLIVSGNALIDTPRSQFYAQEQKVTCAVSCCWPMAELRFEL
jgi:hypothetical protein